MTLKVNDVEISDEAICMEMQYHPANDRMESTTKAAKALLVREILRQEAIKHKYLTENADDQKLETALMKLIEDNVTTPEADDRACAHYYDHNKERFKAQDTGILLPLELVLEQIRNYLHTRSVREGLRSYILTLAQNAQIKGVDLNYL